MQALVIYQGRLLNSKIDAFKEKYKFERIDKLNLKLSERRVSEDNFNYDQFCHDELKSEVNRSYDLIIIHLNLSDYDYGEMYGLRVACHLRLTTELQNTHSQIIILSSDSFEDIMHINPLGSILLTPGTQLSSKFDFTFEFDTKKISESHYQVFLNKINFPNPDNTDNRHSIANELSLFLWSKAIGLDHNSLDQEISTNLYYKWVSSTRRDISIASINENLRDQIIKIGVEGELNIVLIDDEAEKGWEKFYRHLFNLMGSQNSKIEFHSICVEKGSTQEDIVNFCIRKIEGAIKTPHVVLLDLRLVDSDFNNSPTESLTGIRIAKGIEEYNKAIQIIFTTASNKVSSYISASKKGLGVDGYIIKYPSENVENSILNVVNSIVSAQSKSQFLLSVQSRIEKIVRLFPKTEEIQDENIQEFYEESEASIKLAFDILYKAGNDEQFINIAYLEIFKVLENYSKRSDILEVTNLGCKVHNSGKTKSKDVLFIKDSSYSKNLSEWSKIITNEKAFTSNKINFNALEKVRNRVYLILWFRNKVSDKNIDWHNLNDHRNNIAHGWDTDNAKSPQEWVKFLLDFILFMMDRRNEKI
jgi:CheY-like chemotaxis protein